MYSDNYSINLFCNVYSRMNWYVVKNNEKQLVLSLTIFGVLSLIAFLCEAYILFSVFMLLVIINYVLLEIATAYCNKHSKRLKK